MVLIRRAKPDTARALPRATGVAFLLCVSALAFGQAAPEAGDDELAKSIVEKADHVRFPVQPFEASVTISSTDANGAADERRYRVLAKGQENTIVMVTEPASERGQILLMKGHDLWIFLPAVSQPIRLSLAQRLTGQVANGDLARANFAGDYTAKLLRTEKIDNESLYVLELTAIDRSITYHRVMYWVRQANNWPVQGRVLLLVRPSAEDMPVSELQADGRSRTPDTTGHAKRALEGGRIDPRIFGHETAGPSGQGLHQGLPEATRVARHTWDESSSMPFGCATGPRPRSHRASP